MLARHRRVAILGLALVVAGCTSSDRPATPTPTTAPMAARAAVLTWLGHLGAHDDAAAFADLAPRSQAAVGDVDNYRRGSGRFTSIYARFAGPAEVRADALPVSATLVAVTLQVRPATPGEQPAASAVPVRRVSGRWQVDPILDVGSYSFRRPNDGASVSARPTVEVQLDDAATRARVWIDRNETATVTSTSFRPHRPLTRGWHVVTIVLRRGNDIVARTLTIRVTST
jgi:hypothetical protein